VLDVSARTHGAAEIVLTRNGREHRAPLAVAGDHLKGTLAIDDVALWWPHT